MDSGERTIAVDLEPEARGAIVEGLIRERLDPGRTYTCILGSPTLRAGKQKAWLQGERCRCQLLLARDFPYGPPVRMSYSAYRGTPEFAADAESLLEAVPVEVRLGEVGGELRPVSYDLPSGARVDLEWGEDGSVTFRDPETGEAVRILSAP